MDQNKHIVIVSAFPTSDKSLNEYGYHLALNFAQNADVDRVTVIADILDQDLPELDLPEKIRVQRVWSFNSLSSLPKILSAIHREKPLGAIFNVQTATFGDREIPAALGLLAPLLTRIMGTKSGVIAHNVILGVALDDTHLKGQKLRQWVVRKGGRLVTKALISASYTTVTLRSYLDALRQLCPKSDITEIPHGTFDTMGRDWIAQKDRPLRICTMGKFGTYKTLGTLLNAFDLLHQDPNFKNLELYIAGCDHPNAQGYLETLRAQRQDDPNIVFQGYLAEEDIAGFFENARLSVFDYSSTTGSSGVLHQACSYGAVPVFPAIGDFVDLMLSEGIAGRHYASQDPKDMAATIKNALIDVEQSEAIAQSNKRASQQTPMSDIIKFHMDKLMLQ